MHWSQQHLRYHYKHETLIHLACQFSSVTQLYPTLQPYGLQHARLPCPSPTPRACSNSCPSSWWCYPTISFSVAPFASCLQSFTKSGSFPVSRLFTSGGQSITASASDQSFQWIFRTISFRIDWLDLYSPRDSQKSSPTPHFKSINSLALSFLYGPTLTSIPEYWKNHSFD